MYLNVNGLLLLDVFLLLLLTEFVEAVHCLTISKRYWSKEDYPNPQRDIGKCGRNCTKSWICDPSDIINVNQANRLDKKIEEIANSGHCRCSQCNDGYNISIALVSGMDLPFSADKATEAKHFAVYLQKKWNFQKCGNNVVIFISKYDRQVYTAAGPDAYKVLTSECIQKVYNEVKPSLSGGNYSKGLDLMLTKYQEIFANGGCSDTSSGLSDKAIAWICFGAVFVLLHILSLVGYCIDRNLCCQCRKSKPTADIHTIRPPEFLNTTYSTSKIRPTISHTSHHTKSSYTVTSSGLSSGRSGYSGGGGFSGGCSGGGGDGGGGGGGPF